MKTGTNAALSAESATSARTRFGTWNAIVNAEKRAAGAEVARRDDLAHEAGDAREPRRDREDDRVERDPARAG